jgi:hypothetical protein
LGMHWISAAMGPKHRSQVHCNGMSVTVGCWATANPGGDGCPVLYCVTSTRNLCLEVFSSIGSIDAGLVELRSILVCEVAQTLVVYACVLVAINST